MTIRCLTFDLDDTLWDAGSIIVRAEVAAFEWLEHHAPEVVAGRTADELAAHRRAFYSSLPHLSHDFTALRRAWLAHLFAAAGLGRRRSEQAFMAFWRVRNEVAPFPEAIAALERLRRRFVLGTVTNGNASIDYIGLAKYFAFTVTAGEAGVMKPDPGIFAFALAKAGIKPSEAVHIGDDPDADMRGAMNHGMRAVWVNPHGHRWDRIHGAPPHAQIGGLGELDEVLEAWR